MKKNKKKEKSSSTNLKDYKKNKEAFADYLAVMKTFVDLIGDNEHAPRVIKYEGINYGIYTHEGGCFAISEGSDFPISMFVKEDLEDIYNLLKDGKFKIDPSFQG